jgi:hypothetical protein
MTRRRENMAALALLSGMVIALAYFILVQCGFVQWPPA